MTPTRRLQPWHVGLLFALGALALVQLSEAVLLYGFRFIDMTRPSDRVQILPFFNLVMVWNPGISYGLFPARGPAGTALLVVFSLSAVLGLGYWLWHSQRRVVAAGLGLIIGGALGNLIDRVHYGQVADFFHFYVGRFDWYVFNVADCAITVGVFALLYDALRRPQGPGDN